MDFLPFDDNSRPGTGPFEGTRPGTLEIIGKGVMRGGIRSATFGALAGSAFFPSEGDAGPDPERIVPRKEDFFRFIDERLEPAEKFWTPDPDRLTTAGRVVGALSELPLQLVGGMPGIAGTITGATGADLVRQGVDADTAGMVAAGVGVSTTAMAGLPQAGGTLLKTGLLAALNPLTGAATDYAAKKTLEARGYEQQAASFDPFDPAARSVDLLLGAVFGGVAHYGRVKAGLPTEVVDAIDTVELHKQATNLNPHAPGTPEAAAHADALTSAMDALDAGKPVDVAQQLRPAEPERYTADRFRAEAQEYFGLTDEHADAVMALMEARAKVQGEDLDGWIGKRLAGMTGEAPPEGALLQDRPLVEPFYSKLLAEVDTLQQEKWNARDLLNKLRKTPGVKGEEIAWTGLESYLADKKSVTRDEVRAYLQKNQVQVQEIVKRAGGYPVTKADIDLFYRLADKEEAGRITQAELKTLQRMEWEGSEAAQTRFDEYQLPGGDGNYRELLLTLPMDLKRRPFASTHFDEADILAHVRFNDRTGADGSRVLHIEEIQSDWHQARRAGRDVPDAPFARTWHELALKRVMRWATEHGYDRVTWTTGEQQADRYDISRRVDEVTYQPHGDSWQIDGYWDGKSVLSRRVPDASLNDAVGKELADKIRTGAGAEKYPGTTGGLKSLTGMDLKVGGKGMKGFYDDIVPAYLRKFGAQFGATVGSVELPDAGTVHGMDITDAMRTALNFEGQPLFQGEKGAISFLSDGRAMIHALEAPDFSTLLHEVGHLFDSTLTAAERRTFDTWLHSTVPGQRWNTGQRETFARAFERYLAEGKAPAPELAGIFAKAKEWLLTIYERITGTAIDVRMNDNVRAAFDRMLWDSKINREVPPEVATVRTAVQAHAVELNAELTALADEIGDVPDYPPPRPTGAGIPDPPKPERLHGPLGDDLDVVNSFTRNPAKVPAVLADFLHNEADLLAASESGKVVIDGYQKSATWSDAQGWFLDRNRSLRSVGGNEVGKDSVVSALRKAADGQFDKLTAGQQDMVLEAVNAIGGQIHAMSREVDGIQLQVGDRFTTVHLEPRTVVGERAGRLLLDSGESIPMDKPFRIVGEIDSTGRDGYAMTNPADIILSERGDFDIWDGTDGSGADVHRSAQEMLTEARDAVTVAENQQHLYHRAAVCMGLG